MSACNTGQFHRIIFAGLILTTTVCGSSAWAQNQDPAEVFERAERRQQTGVDIHFEQNCVDDLLQPLMNCRDNTAAAGRRHPEAAPAQRLRRPSRGRASEQGSPDPGPKNVCFAHIVDAYSRCI